MKYEIEIQETVTKINKYTIGVKSEKELEQIIYDIDACINSAESQDDVLSLIKNSGYEVAGIIEGAEDVEYELL